MAQFREIQGMIAGRVERVTALVNSTNGEQFGHQVKVTDGDGSTFVRVSADQMTELALVEGAEVMWLVRFASWARNDKHGCNAYLNQAFTSWPVAPPTLVPAA